MKTARYSYDEAKFRNERYAQILGEANSLKEEIYRLYDAFVNNYGKPYHEFMDSVFKDINIKITDKNERLNYINKRIKRMKEAFSTKKGSVMTDIYNYSIYLATNKVEQANECKEKIDSYFKSIEELKLAKKHTKEKNEEMHENLIKKLKEDVQKVLNDEEINIKNEKNFNNKVRSNYKVLSKDEYLDFVIKRCSVEPITEEEVMQLLEVVTFFIDNIGANIDKLLALDPEKDDVMPEINRYKLHNEENVKECYKVSANRYYNWKLKSLKRLLDAYLNYRCFLLDLLGSKNLNYKLDLDDYSKKLINNECSFLIDFYNSARKIKDVDKSYVNGMIARDDVIKEYKKAYINKVLVKKENK